MPEPILTPVTVANAEENKRLASIAPQPAQGGWAPGAWVPLVIALLVGALGSVGALIASGTALTLASVLGATLLGLSGALAAFFGVKSAGPRTP